MPRGDTLVVVHMEREPEALPGLTVRAPRGPCTGRDDPRGRALWNALRDRYRGGTDTTTVVAYFRRSVAVAPRSRLGAVDTAGAARGWIKSYPGTRRFWRALISAEGYAHEIRESMDPAYAGWHYPPLESQYPTHFVEELFGARHVFAAVGAGQGGTLLRFCPRTRSGRRPWIEGTLMVAADGALVRAAWSYATPEPRQDAGAEVDFAPASPGHSLLLPATSTYWRRTTGGAYYREWAKYSDWRVAAQDAVPDPAAPPP